MINPIYMSDVLTPEQRHHNMVAIRSANTNPEVQLRRYLWRAGFRYRVNDKKLPGRPDIVLPKYKTVVFVNGCFWHGHEECKRFVIPKTNTKFWSDKINKNKERDTIINQRLEEMGWKVITVWECQIENKTKNDTFKTIINGIRKQR